MKPRIVQDTLYGDYRDNLETSQYTYKLDLSTILYNLTDEDCTFILSTLYKNILFGEDIEKDNTTKKYTDQDVETIIRCCWNAAREKEFPKHIKTFDDSLEDALQIGLSKIKQ